MRHKTILAAALLAAISAPAMAVDCPDVLFADGLSTHGAQVCNPAWLNRPGAVEAREEVKRDCSDAGEEMFLKYAIGGAKAFDRRANKVGLRLACKSLDEDMTKLDAAMAIPDEGQ